MDLTKYTTPTEVRAILGVNSKELPDNLLLFPTYLTTITLGLEDINSGIPTLFATVAALPSANRSAQQARFFDLVTLYAPYIVAKQLLTSLSMFSVLKITDGRAEFSRQKDAYLPVAEGVDAMISGITTRIAITYAALTPGADVITAPSFVTMMLNSALATDPVTNA